MALCRLDGANEPVCLIVDPGGEEAGVRVTCQTPVPTRHSPQAVTRHRLVTLVLELAEEGTAPRIEGSDAPIAEIADEHVVAELPEPFGDQSQAPRRGDRTMRSEAPVEVPSGVEDIDEPIARTSDVVMMDSVLQGKGDVKVASDVLDAEEGETSGRWAGDRALTRHGRVSEGLDQAKMGIELLNGSEAEVGGKQEVARARVPCSQPFVDRAHEPTLAHGGAIHCEDRVGRVHVGVPAGDCAIFGRK